MSTDPVFTSCFTANPALHTPQLNCIVLLHQSHTHTHTSLTALCPGLPGWAGTRKVTPIWIFLKQQTVSGSDISWAICKSAPRSRQITMPAPHRLVFLQAGCPSRYPTNSVKALKASVDTITQWREDWSSASVLNHTIVTDPVADPVKFQKLLKSHYFSQAFNIWFFCFLSFLAVGWPL